ncbi:fungal-specific transcription factor domain-containing protein [Daedaleopsis nitida]|nr:fungal-specific transcription factor domain-containing protein [Daedaleopsis nitida]
MRSTGSYVEALEDRVRKMELIVRKVQSSSTAPDATRDRSAKRTMWAHPTHTARMLSQSAFSGPRGHAIEGEEEDVSDDELEDFFKMGSPFGYHGKSSSKDLLIRLIALKEPKSHSFHEHPMSVYDLNLPRPLDRQLTSPTHFPNLESLRKLVDSYFTHFNLYLPLLHRPTFEKDIETGLYLRDRECAAIVLLVCAIGSIWIDSPRNIHEELTVGSRGREWFDQVRYEPCRVFNPPRLHDVQVCALMAAWLNCAGPHAGGWIFASLGIRMAQDIGAHRKKMYSMPPILEQELWKRAFWILVIIDRLTSFAIGRPSSLHDEDFDVDPMIECDDENWSPSGSAMTSHQPAGMPSKVAFANHFARLMRILDFASRTIYTINNSKLLFGFVGAEWKQEVVTELDSALNRWIASVPAHLRWEPSGSNLDSFNQSARLHIHYYLAQIAVHRPFIPRSGRSPNVLPFPSLTICTSAARSCVSVLDAQHRRTRTLHCALTPMPLQMPLATACVTLLINLWGGNPSESQAQALWTDVRGCLTMLESMESEIAAARKIRAVLNALISVKFPRPPSATKEGPADIGELMVTALENLHISLEEAAVEAQVEAQVPRTLCQDLDDSAFFPLLLCPMPRTANGDIPKGTPRSPPLHGSQSESETDTQFASIPLWQLPLSWDERTLRPEAVQQQRSNGVHSPAVGPSRSSQMDSGVETRPLGYDDLLTTLSIIFPNVEPQALSDAALSSLDERAVEGSTSAAGMPPYRFEADANANADTGSAAIFGGDMDPLLDFTQWLADDVPVDMGNGGDGDGMAWELPATGDPLCMGGLTWDNYRQTSFGTGGASSPSAAL